MDKISKNSAKEFNETISELGKNGIKALVKSFEDSADDIEKAGENALKAFVKGLKNETKNAQKACKDIAEKCADAIGSKTSSFEDAGGDLVSGFARGISSNSFKAAAKAKAMAQAAANAAKKILGINSPSRVFYEIGDYTGQGFVNAIDDYATASYKAGSVMGDSARRGLSDTVRRINDAINSDMDMQPTIRPVLDLSDIRSGAGAIGSMLGFGSSIGVLSNVGTVSSMMNRRNQSVGNTEVVSAIDKLRKDLGNLGNTTYNVNGITYDDGSNISEAVKSLVRAAKVERRM